MGPFPEQRLSHTETRRSTLRNVRQIQLQQSVLRRVSPITQSRGRVNRRGCTLTVEDHGMFIQRSDFLFECLDFLKSLLSVQGGGCPASGPLFCVCFNPLSAHMGRLSFLLHSQFCLSFLTGQSFYGCSFLPLLGSLRTSVHRWTSDFLFF